MSAMTDTTDREISERYSVLIQWSDEDAAYIVTLPEFPGCHTHGATREEALKNSQEVIELLIQVSKEDNSSLPEPSLFHLDEAETGGPENAERSEAQEYARQD